MAIANKMKLTTIKDGCEIRTISTRNMLRPGVMEIPIPFEKANTTSPNGTKVTLRGYLFYPRAGEYREQAKGATGVDTMLNLTTMLDTSAKAAQGGKGNDKAFDDLHNQFHALLDSFCGVTKEQANTPAYALAVTHKKELGRYFYAAVEIQGRPTPA